MSLRRTIAAGLRGLFRRAEVEQELDDEVQHYLAMAVEEHRRAGLTPEQAARAARLELGSIASTKEEARSGGWEAGVEMVWRDARFAARRLRRHAGFTAVATLTLALGIGATTAMFSIVAALDLRALPFRDAGRIVVLGAGPPCEGEACGRNVVSSRATFDEWWTTAHSFERLAGVTPRGFFWLRDGEIDEIAAAGVMPELFSLLGVRPALGRGILPADTVPGAEHVVVLGDSLWRARFGADPAVIGTRIELQPEDDGTTPRATIVGVMPRGFRFLNEAVWLPMTGTVGDYRDVPTLFVLGRLRPGATLDGTNAELRLLAARMAAASPNERRDWSARAIPLRETYVEAFAVGDRRFLLLGIAGLVLAVAAVNVAALALTRVVARQEELAVRLALGARRRQLARQIVIESMIPTLVAGVLGALLARWATPIQARFAGLDSFGIPVPVDLHVLGFVLLLSVALGIGVGLVAAVVGLPRAHAGVLQLRLAGRTTRERQGWLGDAFVLAQVACAFVLVTGAMLLTKELLRLERDEPGFDPRNLHQIVATAPEHVRDDPPQQRLFATAARDRLAQVPGVVGAALGPTDFGRGPLRIDGAAAPLPAADRPMGMSVDERYFPLFETEVRRGRAFTATDGAGAAPVAVVNEAAAARLWPGRSALGRRLFFGDDSGGGTWATVVGVVANAKVINASLTAPPKPIVYRPFAQAPLSARVFVRTTGDSARVVSDLRAALREITGQPTNRERDIGSPAAGIASQLASQRFTARALTAFALFGLLLAAMGLYATVAASVARRTHEIGVRMALGATRRSVLALVTRRSAWLAAVGLAAGVGASLAVTRVLQAMLVGTSPTDPTVLASAGASLALAIAVASWLPARRATRIEPVEALRVD